MSEIIKFEDFKNKKKNLSDEDIKSLFLGLVNLIIIENFVKKIISKNSFITLSLKIENGESFIINVEPLENSLILNFPYKIYVENINNNLIIKSNNIEVLNYKNAYFITLNNL